MSKIIINKPEAARRQIDAAIRLLFLSEDPVPIHTLVMASFNILRDLDNKNGGGIVSQFSATLKPEMEKQFWGSLNSLSNFCKHADRDPNSIHDQANEEVNDVALAMCCKIYNSLGYQFTPEMHAFIVWFMCLNNNMWNDSGLNLPQQFEHMRTLLATAPRETRLQLGQKMLNEARTNSQSRYGAHA